MVPTKIKYITNKDLLAEIKNCKASYSHFVSPQHAHYDVIVTGTDLITAELLAETIIAKANKLSTKTNIVDPVSILPEDVVFRVMTDTHLPPPADKNKRRETITGEMVKANFSPFRHYILRDGELIEVGRSHWKGDFETGHYCVIHGKINNRLASMFMLLVEQYSRRGNWRGYCGSVRDQALCQRGWLGIDEITENDRILSYDMDRKQLVWSSIKSIYRSHYKGKMHHLTGVGIDAIVTPGHRFVTDEGLTRVEYLREKDRLILMGDAVEDTQSEFPYSDAFVELIGWFVTEGNYHADKSRNYVRCAIYQNEGDKADRIRACLSKLIPKWGETRRKARNQGNENIQIAFTLPKVLCQQISLVTTNGGEKALSYDFIMSLSKAQRQLLIETMVAGDGIVTKKGTMIYAQKSEAHVDAFLLLSVLNGYKPSYRFTSCKGGFGKRSYYYLVNLSPSKQNHTRLVKSIDFHGGKNIAHGDKLDYPNEPTLDYDDRVWCPETEYGNFIVRSGDKIYCSSNTYNDEMRSHALVQLSQVALQFDESRSDNPFSFYTQIIKNCLAGDTEILTREYGAVPIAQISEQDVTLLDGNGEWIKCHVYDYGVQETVNLNFSGYFEKVSIRSTLDHGWVQQGTGERIETHDFVHRNGYATRDVFIADLRPSQTIIDNEEYRKGVIHGVIYGDGGKSYNDHTFTLRLCGEKRELLPWFFEYTPSYPNSNNGDPNFYLSNMWANLKSLPSEPGRSLDYLRGFLRGWVATDGCVSTEGDVTVCGDDAEYQWLKQWAPLIGWHVGSATVLSSETNYGIRKKISCNIHLKKHSMNSDDFLRERHRERFVNNKTQIPSGWRVYPGKCQTFERRMERVYCPDVPTTHTVALASGIHSFQCFRRILNIEKRVQSTRDDLLIMSGAMPSYTRQVDNEMDQRDEIAEAPKAGKRGRKPKTSS
jgi:hypothetical protein